MTSTEQPTRPTPTPRRGHYALSQEEIDARSIECGVLGCRIEWEYCASACAHRQESICPRNAPAATCEPGGVSAVDPPGTPADPPDATVDSPVGEDAQGEPAGVEGDRHDEQAELGELLAPSDLEHESAADSEEPVTTLKPVDASTDDEPDLWILALQEVGEEGTVLSAAKATPEHIAAWHLHTGKLARMTAARACLIGLALLERKATLRHGEFKTWIEANCSFSYSTANKYTRVARWALEKNRARDFSWVDVSIRKVDRLLPSPSAQKCVQQKETTSSPATTALLVSDQAGVEAPDDVDSDPGHVANEGTIPSEVDTNGDSPVCAGNCRKGCSTPPGIESALNALLEALKRSPDTRAQAVASITRIAEFAGLEASGPGKRIALQSTPSPTAVAKPRPRGRVLRYSDLMGTNGATLDGH